MLHIFLCCFPSLQPPTPKEPPAVAAAATSLDDCFRTPAHASVGGLQYPLALPPSGHASSNPKRWIIHTLQGPVSDDVREPVELTSLSKARVTYSWRPNGTDLKGAVFSFKGLGEKDMQEILGNPALEEAIVEWNPSYEGWMRMLRDLPPEEP